MTSNYFTINSGNLTGRIFRAEIIEVQKPNIARKIADYLIPPPVVQIKLFEIFNAGGLNEIHQELQDLEFYRQASMGMMCQVDLYQLDQLGNPSPLEYQLSQQIPLNNNQLISPPILCTTKLTGNRVTEGTVVYYEGKNTLMFAFADLSVQLLGNFALSYRIFHIFGYSTQSAGTVIPVVANCFGGSFRVYSSHDFPGLQPSTMLTKLTEMSFINVVTSKM
ncbi:hypothetical protein K474DRAFT_1680385 [Panus rudis PR-1116 ss-1]|nr:hypothetical protein K474DRAFT_1680385 [Panus rudis PR-1116 ss-1]